MKKAEARPDTVIWTPEPSLGSSSGAREEEEKGGPEALLLIGYRRAPGLVVMLAKGRARSIRGL
jgi:hypothetical protein